MKMKKHLSKMAAVILAVAMMIPAFGTVYAAGSVNMDAAANTAANRESTASSTYVPADGTYTIGVDTDRYMFYIASDDKNKCTLTVKDGKMTATFRLNGTGYDYVFMGSSEEAAAAAKTEWCKYTLSADNYYTYTVPVSELNKPIKIAGHSDSHEAYNASHSDQKQVWYDHTITFSYSAKPAATSISSLTAGKNSIKITWKKQTADVSGYQIQYSIKSSMKNAKTVKTTANATFKTIKNLKSGSKYYFRIRTLSTSGEQTLYSSWSKIKSIKVK